jgi:hypothetical protein
LKLQRFELRIEGTVSRALNIFTEFKGPRNDFTPQVEFISYSRTEHIVLIRFYLNHEASTLMIFEEKKDAQDSKANSIAVSFIRASGKVK